MNGKGLHTYSFQTDLIIDAGTRDLAEARLKLLLQHAGISSYRIGKSSLVGAAILDEDESASSERPAARAAESPSPAAGHAAGAAIGSPAVSTIMQHMKDKKLVRLSINKGMGVRLSIPCRILNVEGDLITIYHVDEKQVYTFLLQEIDDFE